MAKYIQNDIIYVNSVKTNPFILIFNIHVKHSERYEKTNSILIKVFISEHLGLGGGSERIFNLSALFEF